MMRMASTNLECGRCQTDEHIIMREFGTGKLEVTCQQCGMEWTYLPPEQDALSDNRKEATNA